MGSGLFGRAIIVGVGALFAVGGLAIIVGGGPPASGGLSLVVIGLVFILAGVLERMRYRSESAETSGLPVGPGGGDPIGEPIEARFQRTGEAFFDPTSGHRMRVWLDSATGDQRYRAEE